MRVKAEVYAQLLLLFERWNLFPVTSPSGFGANGIANDTVKVSVLDTASESRACRRVFRFCEDSHRRFWPLKTNFAFETIWPKKIESGRKQVCKDKTFSA